MKRDSTTVCLHVNYKAHMACDLSSLSKMREFTRSQAVTFTSTVVVSKNGAR